jgi:hypothetical protein
MSHFFRNGNTFRVADDKAIEVHEFLPAGNYIVKMDPFENFFLEEVEQFKPIKKVYGDALKNADRILNTFASREMSTGVLLNGEKGSGKTLLAKTLSIEAGNKGIPTIIINTDWHGDKFNKLIQDINQPAIIMFDEFEKVYGEETQEAVLTLMDGVFPTKKLFVLTCNDKWRINSHMRNRPGRLYYMIDYKGLDHAFIVEYCQDNLNAKQYIEKICTIASMFDQFNFDMLKALVEEMNRYDESPADALRILNAKPEFDSGSKYSVEVTFEGEKITELRRDEWKGNPLNDDVCFSFFFKSKKTKPVVKGSKGKIKSTLAPALTAAIDDDEDGDRWIDLTFKPNDLYQVFPQEGRYIFRNSQAEAVLTKKVETFYDWRAL